MPHRRKPETLSYGHGFTLIELAIVLVILGLLLGGGSMLLNPLLENNRRNETKARLKVIEDALVIYVASNSDLPCPSNPALGPGSNLNGAEGTNCGAIAGNNVLVSGGVPWRQLGLSESDVTDGWGRRISYAVTRDLSITAGLDPMDCQAQGFGGITNGRLEVRGANDQSVGAAPFRDPDPVRAAYVLVSHGENGTGGYLPSGILTTSPAVSATETANIKAIGVSDQAVFYYEKLSAGDAIVGFDDIVRSRSSGQIAIAYGCATP